MSIFSRDAREGKKNKKPLIDPGLKPKTEDNIHEIELLGGKKMMIHCLKCGSYVREDNVSVGGFINYYFIENNQMRMAIAYCDCKIGYYFYSLVRISNPNVKSISDLLDEYMDKSLKTEQDIFKFNLARRIRLLKELGTPDKNLEAMLEAWSKGDIHVIEYVQDVLCGDAVKYPSKVRHETSESIPAEIEGGGINKVSGCDAGYNAKAKESSVDDPAPNGELEDDLLF